jgi:hypothetical protein
MKIRGVIEQLVPLINRMGHVWSMCTYVSIGEENTKQMSESRLAFHKVA